MSVDYEQQLKDNEAAKQRELQKVKDSYSQTASDYQAEVDKQTQELENYKAEQTRLQQEQTDFAIDKIEQQQEQAEKDYTKEQQAAYGDYKKQTDPYGVNAEQMAAMGLSQSGYSESSNVAMYTAYQNRVAAARASIEQAKQTFENAIQEAKLTNDINLAKIAQEVLEKKLALSMESVIYLGSLEQEKATKLSAIEQTYYDRAQEIRDAQQAEIERAQEIRDAQQAEIERAQQEALLGALEDDYAITGDEGDTGGADDEKIDESIKTVLSTVFPNGVITDENTWNDLVNEYGEEQVREWGYKPVNKPAGVRFTQQILQDLQKNHKKLPLR